MSIMSIAEVLLYAAAASVLTIPLVQIVDHANTNFAGSGDCCQSVCIALHLQTGKMFAKVSKGNLHGKL